MNDRGMDPLITTPKHDGLRMPGEFEPHSGCWMIWPEQDDGWAKNPKPAQDAYRKVAETVAMFEAVTMGVSPQHVSLVRAELPKHIRVVPMDHDSAWARDTGPTFVVGNGEVRGVDWKFNAWGGLLAHWEQDSGIAKIITDIEHVGRYDTPFILEGGSIHVDGEGTLVATEECLLNKNRNPELTRESIENYLKEYLNVSKIIWLPQGLYLDETDGHVDNVCCFVKPGVVVLAWTDDIDDPNYERLHKAFGVLQKERDARGRKFEIIKLHLPKPQFLTKEEYDRFEFGKDPNYRMMEGQRLTLSYVNFYIANKGIVMPAFNDPVYDALAFDQIQKAFPERKVVSVPAHDILVGGGGIHCITQQQPVV